MGITTSSLPSLAALALLPIAACAPSLTSQVSSVGTLARVRDLAALREGEVGESTGKALLALLKQPVGADAAVRIGLLNNRELRARLRELGVTAGQLVTASLVANPRFEMELLPERDSKYELRAEYDLSSLIMAPLRRAAAYDELEAARLRAAGAVVELGYRVRTRFYALQAAAQRLRLAQQALDALAASRDAAQALVDAGNMRQLDASAQIAAYERSRVEVAKLELEQAERREEMQRLLGLHGVETAWELEGPLSRAPDQLPNSDRVEQSALEANLDLKALKKQLDALAKQTGVVRTQGWLPELDADVHALRVKRDADHPRDEWRWGAGVSLQVPLFDRGQGRMSAIEAQFDAALERYQGLAIDLRSAARDARNRLVSTHARARQYQAVILPAQREVLVQTQLQYNAMQLGVFQLLSARRELLDVELAYIDTLRDYWMARAEIEALAQGRAVSGQEPARSSAIAPAPDRAGGH